MNIAEKLRQLRIENKFTQQEVANRLDISTSAYGFYEQGKNTPPIEKLMQLAELYDISISQLVDEKKYLIISEKSSKYEINSSRRIAVYGSVPAGIPIEAIEDIEDFEDISFDEFSPNKQYIGLKVKGDSMYPKYLENDTIIIEIASSCESGTDAVVYVNGFNATLKKVIKNTNGTITLQPLNPNYPPKTYGPYDEPITVLGIVKQIRRNI